MDLYIPSGRPVMGQNQSKLVRNALSNATSQKQKARKGNGGLAEMTTREYKI
jgi:hypothetical protein